MEHYDIIIVGAGLAGLTTAIDLIKRNHSVLVLERHSFPHHKVCGEYVSNEVLPYLESLGICIPETAANIDTLTVSSISGKFITTKLPLGGFGISRYMLDNLMYEKALALGVRFVFQTVSDIEFNGSDFEVATQKGEKYGASFVIGAFGKRSILDKKFNRSFVEQKSPWLGVKAHYKYNLFPDNEVALHNFDGGYGGLSKTETGAVNFCYLVSYESFQKEKDIETFNLNVVARNPFLNRFLKDAEPIFDQPLTIAQISFQRKRSVENHILMCGDSAGLIHPLCGNGMAMAIHGAKIASELVHNYLEQNGNDRRKIEKAYSEKWEYTFQKRLWMGRQLQSLLWNKRVSRLGLSLLVKSPRLLDWLIQSTHGKPIL